MILVEKDLYKNKKKTPVVSLGVNLALRSLLLDVDVSLVRKFWRTIPN